ncbi:VanZ family protein [Bacilliculturomica massiliensis]|uniref:VanZ family protein n=1 Tax=Bacilliculturomica massiliensis TaxID=1917867 RepID=UPI00102FADCA|nr:VanZ family protein [Bacilliculturomica massiliensis]
MRFDEVAGMLREHFMLALAGTLLLACCFLAGYFIVYRKWMKGRRELTAGRALLWFLFAGYLLMVLGLTLFSRGRYSAGGTNLHLFSSWREAWNSGRLTAWQFLTFNILMFVPMGVFLPLCIRKLRKPAAAVGVSFLFSLLIESVQLVTGWGIFELDDLFNNTLGAVLGCSLVMAVMAAVEKPPRRSMTALYLLPLVLTAGLFGGLALKYTWAEYGNLDTYSYRQNMTGVEVSVTGEYSGETERAEVYRVRVMEREEALTFAQDFYERLGADRSIVTEDTAYNDNAVYKASGPDGEGPWLLWLYFMGGRYSFTDFGAAYGDEGDPESAETVGATEEQARAALSALGVEIPASAAFSAQEDAYIFDVETVEGGGRMLRGQVTCRLVRTPAAAGDSVGAAASAAAAGTDGEAAAPVYRPSRVENNLITYEPYKSETVISRQDACDEVLSGRFSMPLSEKLRSLSIGDVRLDHQLDTKGFYQPVYLFDAKINDTEGCEIMVPALAK